MASGFPSVPLLRRGLISCLHSSSCRADDAPLLSDEDLHEATLALIVGFYDEAFDRLPCETMPDLGRLINTGGGLCLGLLDPVSNIILNTVALLPDIAAASSSPTATKRSKRSWDQVARLSYCSLVDFLVSYFGCLTREQAVRYLYWARADLPLAVMLVQHDLYEKPQVLDPASPRTQAALKLAASEASHPTPDILVQVMTIRLRADAVALLKKQLQFADQDHSVSLTSQDVGAINRLLHGHGHRDNIADITKSSVDVSPDGSTVTTTTTTVRRAVGRVTSLRPIQDMADKLSSCLTKAGDQKHTLKTQCGGDACDYAQSLNMYLHGMIHDFYIKALMLLPTPSGSLMRSFLMAGHCYGSMDPVSNIMVNCIWHNKRGCPLSESDRNEIEPCTDVFDPLSLLRAEVHSLNGLMKLAAAFAADPQSSTAACALESLCSAKCDIVNMLSSSSYTQRFENKNPFHEAAMAARHPLPLHLGELHRQLLLMPVEKTKLLSLIAEAQTSSTVLPVDDIASILDTVLSGSKAPTLILMQAPKLCAEALREVSSYRSHYATQRSLFRPNIDKVLREYCSQHFWEQKYSLDFIFGVEQKKTSVFNMCYHVNFVASCDSQLQKTFFFAELWYTHPPKQNFCCPLPYPYDGGVLYHLIMIGFVFLICRCYYGVHTARKIVYPDRAEYFEHDVTRDGTGSVGGILAMDLVHMSFERDVDLAKDLNTRSK